MAPSMNRWRWQLLRGAEGLGLPGIVAGVVALGAIAAWFAIGLPGAHELEQLQADNARVARQIAARIGVRRDEPVSDAKRLASFEASFPSARGLSQGYARLFALAQRHGLKLRQADFKLADGTDALARYAIVLPVSAEYPSLRAFVADALRENPALALEEMSLRRPDARSPQVEARLRFVLFVRRPE